MNLKIGSFILFMTIVACQNKPADTEAGSPSTEASPANTIKPMPLQVETPVVNGNNLYPDSASVRKFILGILDKKDLEIMSPGQRRYRYTTCDLNDDGKNEYLVYFLSSYFCGTGGCTFALLNSEGKLVNNFTVAEPPFFIATEINNGWHDLLITSKGKLHRMVYNGKRYPGNPSVGPLVTGSPDSTHTRLFSESSESPTLIF